MVTMLAESALKHRWNTDVKLHGNLPCQRNIPISQISPSFQKFSFSQLKQMINALFSNLSLLSQLNLAISHITLPIINRLIKV
jgi:hypothetical protein